jgi:crotonobetaine/carnitine-CoA ligase
MNPVSTERRWDSIGRPLPGVAVRLLSEDGSPAPVGTPGEMTIGGTPGRTLAAGYLNMPEETERTFGGGWLRTGDLATVDRDGFYYFLERAKDIVKRGGENLSVTEIELVVAQHPAVAEVAAIGVPDALRDEAVLAFVVVEAGHPRPHPAELEAWCRERLAPFKVPSGFAFVESLPRTSIGKLNRRHLREHPAAEHLVAVLDPFTTATIHQGAR